jgi:hypothetical protein
VIAGLLYEVMEAGTFAAEDQAAVGGGEVEVGVVGGSALVEADDPDVGLLHLLERADEVGNAGDADVLGGSGGGLGDHCGDGGGAALGEEDAVDAGAVGGAEEGAKVMRVFDAVEGEEKAVAVRWRCQKVLNSKELAVAEEGDDALVHVSFGETGELVAGLEGDADVGGAGEGGKLFELAVGAFAGY